MALIELNNVSFKYKGANENALENICLSINEGQIIGLLGPNGAGKTTIIKMLVGLIKNFTGTLTIDGHEIDEHTKSLVSYLPDKTYIDEELKIKNVVDMFKDYYKDFNIDKMNNLLANMHLSMESTIKTLSKGNKEKLQLALVLARESKIYILDEPIAGVDPAQREFIINTILASYAKNAVVIISTHLIEDIESILDRAIFVKYGHIVLDDSVNNICALHENKSLNDVFKEVFRC